MLTRIDRVTPFSQWNIFNSLRQAVIKDLLRKGSKALLKKTILFVLYPLTKVFTSTENVFSTGRGVEFTSVQMEHLRTTSKHLFGDVDFAVDWVDENFSQVLCSRILCVHPDPNHCSGTRWVGVECRLFGTTHSTSATPYSNCCYQLPYLAS